MTMTLRLMKIGNSKGIQIPEELIQRYHIGAELELTETTSGILLQPTRLKKLTLDESLDAMAKEFAENQAELKIWDATIADGLDDDEFKDGPR